MGRKRNELLAQERTTKVTLVANVSQYLAGMKQAADKTRETGTEAEKLAQKSQAFDQIGRSLLAVGAVAGVAVGLAVAKFAEFDQAMAYVQAATHETADNMGLLRDAAIEAGASTVYSATEAANAIEELAKAGVSTADILGGGLKGALNLAAAGGLGVAEAAGIAATSLKTFNLQGSEMSHVSDLLAAGAGKAMGDVTDLSAALAQGGQVAKNTGLSIEETTGALAAFASQGLLGSDAGTSFKAMLQRLTPQSAEAKAKMDELGISAYDAQGQFIGLSEFAGNLQDSLRTLTPEQRNSAMATIFGSDAVRAATVLYAEGADGIKDWENAVNDQGYAAETARQRLDNLRGDVEALGGAFDTALIQTGATANDTLRWMTQAATNTVDAYNDLPEGIQGTVMALGGIVTVAGLAGGAFFAAVPKVAAFKTAVSELGPGAQRAGALLTSSFGPIGLAIAAATSLLVLYVGAQAQASAVVQELTDTLDEQTGAFSENTRAVVVKKLQDSGAFDIAKKLGLSLETVTDAAMGNTQAYAEVKQAADDAYGSMSAWDQFFAGWSIDPLVTDVGSLSGALDDSREAFGNQAAAAGESEDKTTDAATAYIEAATEASGLGEQLTQLIDTMNAANGVGQDAVSSNAAYRQSIADADEAIQKAREGVDGYKVSLDETTVAGSANADMLRGVAEKSQEAAKSQFDLDNNTANYKATLEAGRQAIYDHALALSGNADEAQRLTDKIYAIPTEREFEMFAKTQDAAVKLQRIQDLINGIGATAQLHVSTGPGGAGGITQSEGSVLSFYANGGLNENHVAQIAPAGSYRVWAEQETGGEAYIPLAASKRDRSLAIWAETGKRLGVNDYADGSPIYAASGNASPIGITATTGDIYVQVTNPWTGEVLLQRASQIADSKVKQSGVQRRTTLENGVRR